MLSTRDPGRGQIEIKTALADDKRTFTVEVARARDLAAPDPGLHAAIFSSRGSKTHPYVKLYLMPDKAKKSKQKTKVPCLPAPSLV